MCKPTRSSLKRPGRSSQKKKNNVQFAAKHKTKAIPALSTYKEADIDAIWFGRVEVDTIVELANELVLKAEESAEGFTVREINGDCLRGLERKSQDGHTDAFLSRVAVYDAVLDEQDKQWARCSKDDLDMDVIAALCVKASSEAKFAGYQRAKQDEADVQVYLHVEGPFLPSPELLKEDSQTEQNSDGEEPELDLNDVFSKSSPSLSSHFEKESNSALRAGDSWITRETASTNSFSSWDLDSDSEHSSTTTTSTSTASKRTSLTTAKKVVTPAVPRPSGKAKVKRRLPSRKHNASFARTNETANKTGVLPSLAPGKKRPTPKKTQSLGRGLSLECSAFQ